MFLNKLAITTIPFFMGLSLAVGTSHAQDENGTDRSGTGDEVVQRKYAVDLNKMGGLKMPNRVDLEGHMLAEIGTTNWWNKSVFEPKKVHAVPVRYSYADKVEEVSIYVGNIILHFENSPATRQKILEKMTDGGFAPNDPDIDAHINYDLLILTNEDELRKNKNIQFTKEVTNEVLTRFHGQMVYGTQIIQPQSILIKTPLGITRIITNYGRAEKNHGITAMGQDHQGKIWHYKEIEYSGCNVSSQYLVNKIHGLFRFFNEGLKLDQQVCKGDTNSSGNETGMYVAGIQMRDTGMTLEQVKEQIFSPIKMKLEQCASVPEQFLDDQEKVDCQDARLGSIELMTELNELISDTPLLNAFFRTMKIDPSTFIKDVWQAGVSSIRALNKNLSGLKEMQVNYFEKIKTPSRRDIATLKQYLSSFEPLSQYFSEKSNVEAAAYWQKLEGASHLCGYMFVVQNISKPLKPFEKILDASDCQGILHYYNVLTVENLYPLLSLYNKWNSNFTPAETSKEISTQIRIFDRVSGYFQKFFTFQIRSRQRSGQEGTRVPFFDHILL